jgi:hypothetical protein
MDMMEDSVQRDLLIFTTLAAQDNEIVVQKIKDLPANTPTTPTPTTATAADAVVSSKETPIQSTDDLQLTVTLTPQTKQMLLTNIVKSGLETTPDEAINYAIQERYTMACINFASDLLYYDILIATATAMDQIFGTSKVQHIQAEAGSRETVAKRSEEKAAHQIYLVEGTYETVNRFILQRKMANDKRQIISEITNNPKTETDESTKTTPPTEPTAEPADKETHKIDIQ